MHSYSKIDWWYCHLVVDSKLAAEKISFIKWSLSLKSRQKINEQLRRNENELILIYLICYLSGYLTSFNGQKANLLIFEVDIMNYNLLQLKRKESSHKELVFIWLGNIWKYFTLIFIILKNTRDKDNLFNHTFIIRWILFFDHKVKNCFIKINAHKELR